MLLPVTVLLVSLLFRPFGCAKSIGILKLTLRRMLPATAGPMMRAMKTINMIKYSMANRMTLRLRNFDCFNE